MNKLEINKYYNVFTNKVFNYGIKIKVIGILNNEECNDIESVVPTKVIYNRKKMINEEKIVSLDNNFKINDYLSEKQFYKCIIVENPDNSSNDTNPNKVYIFWDEIIDYNRTTLLNKTNFYVFEIKKAIDYNGTDQTILESFKQKATDLGIELTIKNVSDNSDDNEINERNLIEKKIEAYELLSKRLDMSHANKIVKSIDTIESSHDKILELSEIINKLNITINNLKDQIGQS